MPIKGVSDTRRISRIGKIRLGEKKRSAKGVEYPSKIDYFKFDPEDESLLPMCEQLYGDKPRTLKVIFVNEDPEQVFPQHYKCYGASGLLCKGDGAVANRIPADGRRVQENDNEQTATDEDTDDDIDLNDPDSDFDQVKCNGPKACLFSLRRGSHGKPGCNKSASLQFMLPDFPVIGIWQIDTGGFNSIINVNSGLDLLRAIKGQISFVAVDLVLVPKETMDPEHKKQTIYCLDIRMPVSLRNVEQLETFRATVLLPAPPEENTASNDVRRLNAEATTVQSRAAVMDEAPRMAPAHVGRYWKEWLALKEEFRLQDSALEVAKDANQCESFKLADENTCALIINYVRVKATQAAARIETIRTATIQTESQDSPHIQMAGRFQRTPVEPPEQDDLGL